jgi:hypothetical protein
MAENGYDYKVFWYNGADIRGGRYPALAGPFSYPLANRWIYSKGLKLHHEIDY